ncbi:phenylacetate--CoA ligase family protein [soil metagenome]
MSIFENLLQIKGFPIYKAKEKLEEIKGYNDAQINKYHEEKRWEIVKEHFENNPFYKKFNNNTFPKDWNEVPIIKKKQFQTELSEVINPQVPSNRIFKGKTSGSSGLPMVFAKDKVCHALTWAVFIDRYSQFDINPQDKQARFWGMPVKGYPYYEQKLKDFVANRVRFVVNELSDHVLEEYIKKLKKYKFKYIYGYPNALLLFARYLLKKNIVIKEICPSLKCCIVTSEVCLPEDEAILKDAFGVNILNEYGASEIGLIAFPDTSFNWNITFEDLFIEVLDDNDNPVEDGVEGRIIVTSLYNKAMPFIRYELGDITSIKKSSGYPKILNNLQGRLNDTVRLPSGRVFPGATLHYISKVLMNNIKGLKEYNIKQTALDTLEYDFVAEGNVDDKVRKMVENVTFEYLEPGLKIKINKVDLIKRTAAGKFKHFQSFIDSPEILR